MTTQIIYQKNFFADLNGKPLENGSLYIGVANQDPETNPITVYWDSALTQVATQPLSISAGAVMHNGARAAIYCAAGSYSFRARNRSGTVVDYVADAERLSGQLASTASGKGADLVGFIQSGTGAVAETVDSALKRQIWADQFGATFDGSTDDTTNLQKAFTAITALGGGVLNFPANKTVIISQSILVGSNTTINLNGCTVKAKQSGFVGTNAGLNCFLFRNVNYSAASLTDEKIQINGPGVFDYGTVTISGGGAHCIAMRYVDNVTIRDVIGLKGENTTAILACKDTLVENCEGYNQSNCYFDQWDGAGYTKVIGCVGRNDPGVYIAQGIQITGTGSAGENRSSVDSLVAFNYLEGVRGASSTSSALISNANDPDSSTYRTRFIGNTVKNSDLGLVMSGDGGHHESIGDIFVGVDQLPIFLQTTDSDTPSYCRVIAPHLIDCDHAPANVAMISLTGTGHEIARVKITNTSSAAYDTIAYLAATAVNCVVDIAGCPTGLGVRINDSGTGSTIIDGFTRSALVVSTALAGYTIQGYEKTIKFTGTGCTITLPSAASPRELCLVNKGSGTVVSASSNIIPLAGGAAGTAILSAGAKWATIEANGTNYDITKAN